MTSPGSDGHASLIGFFGGVILSTMSNLNPDDLVRTAVLAAVGAAASFVATLVCKIVMSYLRKRKLK